MLESSKTRHQIQEVTNFQDLVSIPFQGEINALCWHRELIGNFAEIVEKLSLKDNITEISKAQLQALDLSEPGKLAREILLNDMKLLKKNGASPSLNLIKYYEKDNSFFPTDVYSFHVDRSPIPTNTFLCTYFGEPSEIVANTQAEQKILIPEIRAELQKLYDGPEDGFEEFLTEYFFDLHYQAKENAEIINLGIGNLWRLAVDCAESDVLPCVHRAPIEKDGKVRLLLIC